MEGAHIRVALMEKNDLKKNALTICKKASKMPKLPFTLTKESINNHSQILSKIGAYGDQDGFALSYGELKDKLY